MKQKTIEKVLTKRFEEFTSSIKDEKVKLLVEKNTIITGGCITSMLLNEKVNDLDLYFTNKETVYQVANYYLNIFNTNNNTSGELIDGDKFEKYGQEKRFTEEQLKEFSELDKGRVLIYFSSTGVAKEEGLEDKADIHELGDTIQVKDDKGEKYRPIYLSSNAITLSNDIQLIIRFYGDAVNIHENYDFAHCTNYWLSENKKLFLNQKALECILSKELFYVGSKYTLASIIRIRKFVQRGWNVNAGQILKMCLQLNDLDLKDPKVLREQLVGVDLAYFGQLLEQIKADNPDKINYLYLSEIIDRIF
jgi:hypothetical protein